MRDGDGHTHPSPTPQQGGCVLRELPSACVFPPAGGKKNWRNYMAGDVRTHRADYGRSRTVHPIAAPADGKSCYLHVESEKGPDSRCWATRSGHLLPSLEPSPPTDRQGIEATGETSGPGLTPARSLPVICIPPSAPKQCPFRGAWERSSALTAIAANL